MTKRDALYWTCILSDRPEACILVAYWLVRDWSWAEDDIPAWVPYLYAEDIRLSYVRLRYA